MRLLVRGRRAEGRVVAIRYYFLLLGIELLAQGRGIDQRSVAPLHPSGWDVVPGVTLLPQVVTASPRSGTAADCSAETSL